MNADIPSEMTPASSARVATPTDHRLVSDEGALSVVFFWRTDRYAHVIDAAGQRQMASIEGTPEDDWPASAAISQLSTEIIDGQPAVLGVGCSGTTHFSVSVQLDRAADGRAVIRFDWAARLAKEWSAGEIADSDHHAGPTAQPLAWLGSTYRRRAGGPEDWHVKTIDATLSTHGRDESDQRWSLHPRRVGGERTVEWSYQIQFNHDLAIQ